MPKKFSRRNTMTVEFRDVTSIKFQGRRKLFDRHDGEDSAPLVGSRQRARAPHAGIDGSLKERQIELVKARCRLREGEDDFGRGARLAGGYGSRDGVAGNFLKLGAVIRAVIRVFNTGL